MARASPPAFFLDLKLRPNPHPDFLSRKPCNTNHFVTIALAGGNGNGRSRNLQKIRKEFDAGLVGAPIDGRRGKGEFKRIAKFAGDSTFLCARVNSDRESGARYGLMNSNQNAFLCVSSVSPVVKLLFARQKSPFPHAHKSIPLQSRLRNRATCPSKADPS